MTIGSLAIRLAFILAAAAFVSALGWSRGRESWRKPFTWAYWGMTLALAVASVVLMRAILTHDFRFDYVIGYSSRDLPLIYLVSAFWGGQEGTYLLWSLFGAIFGFFLFRKGSWHPGSVMAAYVPTIAVLILFMLNRDGDPFRLAAQVPADGRGLNPLLQDPWMAAHPPIVFLGYAAMTAPAVLAWIAAFRRDEKTWVAPALRFALLGFITLGTGIVMGGVWAYKVLGWGGFWGWDPVENASLIPWIVITALIHGLLVQTSTGALKKTNLVLAMAGYLLVMYATFLTRSGVLADFSVHSFPKGTIYEWLVGTMVAILLVSGWALLARKAPPRATMESRLAWPLVLSTTIVLFAVSAVFVLVGTSWPILSSWFGNPSTPTAPFYNQVNLPVYVILLALLGLGPFLAWVPLPGSVWIRRFAPSVVLASAGTVLAWLAGGRGVGSLALFFVALLAFFSNLLRFVSVLRRRPLYTGAAVAHIGFALMFVGIVAGEAWDATVRESLPLGEARTVMGRRLTFEGRIEGSEPKDRWLLRVEEPGGGTARPAELTLYFLPDGQLFRKPAILRGVEGDLYIAPAAVEAGGPTGERLVLGREEPLAYDDSELTFLRFDLGGGGMSSGVMSALIRVETDGGADTVALPFHMDGMHGEPIEIALLGGTRLTLEGMSVEAGQVRVLAQEPGGSAAGTAVLYVEASTKPLIWLVWLGTLLVGVGCVVALVRRTVERHALAAARPETARRQAVAAGGRR